jgi:hypothetical protein
MIKHSTSIIDGLVSIISSHCGGFGVEKLQRKKSKKKVV